jgi:hypothetical protein
MIAIRLSAVVLAALIAAPTAAPAVAQNYWAMSCGQLWSERNAYYKARGYCFKTPAAIRAFGNEGCYVERERDIRFTPAERRRIERIRAAERDLGCS